MIFESLADKRPQEAALFLRPYLVSVSGLPAASHTFYQPSCAKIISYHT